MAMAEVRHCPKCGAPLRADTTEASAPACALRGAFAEEDPNAECGVRSVQSLAEDRPPSPQPSPPGEVGAHDTPGHSTFPGSYSPLGRHFGDYELLEEIA